MKQTAVEYLESQIMNLITFDTVSIRKEFNEKIKYAKEMEQEQMKEFAENYADQVMATMLKKAEQYYKEHYGK